MSARHFVVLYAGKNARASLAVLGGMGLKGGLSPAKRRSNRLLDHLAAAGLSRRPSADGRGDPSVSHQRRARSEKHYVFAQLRGRERRAGRAGSLFFWRDRTREVDFVVDVGGRLELFEAKWTELPAASDAANLSFVPQAVGKAAVITGRWSLARGTAFHLPMDSGPCRCLNWDEPANGDALPKPSSRVC
jgi:uncharacterized protein DUF4143